MDDKAELRRAARTGLDALLTKVLALHPELVRAVQACEVATGHEHPLLEMSTQDIGCLIAAIRRELLDLDALDLGKLAPLPELRRIGS